MDRAELVTEINEMQRRVDRERRGYQLDIWMSLPLTIAQLKSLFFISNLGSTNSKTLAEALGVTPTNVTGIVDRLVKQGLVSRTEDPQDRRMLLLKTTKKGEELVFGLRERRRTGFARVLARMKEHELATLHRGLTSLVRAIEKGGHETD